MYTFLWFQLILFEMVWRQNCRTNKRANFKISPNSIGFGWLIIQLSSINERKGGGQAKNSRIFHPPLPKKINKRITINFATPSHGRQIKFLQLQSPMKHYRTMYFNQLNLSSFMDHFNSQHTMGRKPLLDRINR